MIGILATEGLFEAKAEAELLRRVHDALAEAIDATDDSAVSCRRKFIRDATDAAIECANDPTIAERVIVGRGKLRALACGYERRHAKTGCSHP